MTEQCCMQMFLDCHIQALPSDYIPAVPLHFKRYMASSDDNQNALLDSAQSHYLVCSSMTLSRTLL